MAEVVELTPVLDEEEEDDDEEKEAEEGEEEEDESLYWSRPLFPIHFDLLFTSGCRSSSSHSEESSIAASDYCDFNIPLPHDSSDHTPPSPILDPDPETLVARDFSVLDDVHDFSDEAELGAIGNRLLVSSPESSGGDLRIVDFGSESDSSEIDAVIPAADWDTASIAPDWRPGDLGQHHSWGFIPIDDVRGNSTEEFEWEEVDDRLDDRGVLSMMVDINDDEGSIGRREGVDLQLQPEEAGGEVVRDLIDRGNNIAWEFLLNNSGTPIEFFEDIPEFEDDQEVFINPSDYEFQFGLLGHDNFIRGNPPAAILVVDTLPSILLREEDLTNNNCLCAICKDEFLQEERANQLPCSHLYHSECILPWLGIRNTCPVCRYELPTDDPEYERLKGRT